MSENKRIVRRLEGVAKQKALTALRAKKRTNLDVCKKQKGKSKRSCKRSVRKEFRASKANSVYGGQNGIQRTLKVFGTIAKVAAPVVGLGVLTNVIRFGRPENEEKKGFFEKLGNIETEKMKRNEVKMKSLFNVNKEKNQASILGGVGDKALGALKGLANELLGNSNGQDIKEKSEMKKGENMYLLNIVSFVKSKKGLMIIGALVVGYLLLKKKKFLNIR